MHSGSASSCEVTCPYGNRFLLAAATAAETKALAPASGAGRPGSDASKVRRGNLSRVGTCAWQRARAHAHAPAHRLSLDRLHAVQWTPLVLTLPCCTLIPNQTSQALGFTCISLPCPRGISDRIANFYERCLGFACTRAQGRVEMWGGPNACQKLEFYETDADIAPYVSCVIITD